jgi:hypothetical protein
MGDAFKKCLEKFRNCKAKNVIRVLWEPVQNGVELSYTTL